ncbi:hypothetical protein [Flavobacterium sp.]|jgi:hypothetical protein|uniref:hypothetical protein n=1 Tax=Flavobacterium sp. TaxID=239 RepID=UPI0037C0B96C
MKNLLKSALVLFAISSLFQSCSSSEEVETPVTNQISVDGQPYNILPSNSVVELKMNNLNIDGQLYDRSSISIIGMSGTTVANVSFDLYYKDGLPMAGTYNIDQTIDNDSDFFDNLLVTQKLCLGWTSMCAVNQAGSSSFLINANNPTGTVKVVNNGNNNYTIQYNGNYKKYDTNFVAIGTVPVVINLTTDVLVQ